MAFFETLGSSVSVVDRPSFAFMLREGVGRAIALDVDFRTSGFETIDAAVRAVKSEKNAPPNKPTWTSAV